MSKDIVISALRRTQSVLTHPQVWDTPGGTHSHIGPGSGREWPVCRTLAFE